MSLLEMFTGLVSWELGALAGRTLEQFLEHNGENDYIPPMPAEVAELLRRCFQTDERTRPRSMGECAEALTAIYQKELGRAYERSKPQAADLLADGLNNRGVFYCELGRPERALELWEEALRAEPHHPESTYNRNLVQWRTGEIDDIEQVHGNVSEWVQDHPHYYTSEALVDPIHAGGYIGRLRGGGWSSDDAWLRSGSRSELSRKEQSWNVGFRVARTLPLPASNQGASGDRSPGISKDEAHSESVETDGFIIVFVGALSALCAGLALYLETRVTDFLDDIDPRLEPFYPCVGRSRSGRDDDMASIAQGGRCRCKES